mmetsp:Transcript_7384/g.17620  ORF Transcript_7384/g.17620 Transcript_7384/m.17620 type:complete len:83 (+) Transcript_7384:1900-2148(+)
MKEYSIPPPAPMLLTKKKKSKSQANLKKVVYCPKAGRGVRLQPPAPSYNNILKDNNNISSLITPVTSWCHILLLLLQVRTKV